MVPKQCGLNTVSCVYKVSLAESPGFGKLPGHDQSEAGRVGHALEWLWTGQVQLKHGSHRACLPQLSHITMTHSETLITSASRLSPCVAAPHFNKTAKSNNRIQGIFRYCALNLYH